MVVGEYIVVNEYGVSGIEYRDSSERFKVNNSNQPVVRRYLKIVCKLISKLLITKHRRDH